ncbi:type II secretion system protein N [Sandaracinobacteroides hominis]|uniref:type II secretion system protein N n=1 Tax=Sandaracinobacteroides hominis TaxID=2780086 RepID=UPI0018F43BC4|nr:type II secretion system protein N [Sandaracinobacteroides hominis]
MPVARFNAGHLVLLALALACALLGWRSFASITQPLPALPPFTAPPMADRALLARFDPFFPARAGSGENLPVTALPFSLHGVRADSATGRGSAIIASGDGQQQVYAVGDTVGDGVTLAAIAADHVVFDRGGTRETLWLDSGSGEAVQRFEPTPPPPPAGANATEDPAPPSDLPDTEDATPAARPAPQPEAGSQ